MGMDKQIFVDTLDPVATVTVEVAPTPPLWGDLEVNETGRTVAPPGWYFATHVMVARGNKTTEFHNPLCRTLNVEGWEKTGSRVELKAFPKISLREANARYMRAVRQQNAADARNMRGVGAR